MTCMYEDMLTAGKASHGTDIFLLQKPTSLTEVVIDDHHSECMDDMTK